MSKSPRNKRPHQYIAIRPSVRPVGIKPHGISNRKQ